MNSLSIVVPTVVVVLGIIYYIPRSSIPDPVYVMATKPLKAFVLGGTGTVGKSIVKALIDNPTFEKVTLIGRRNVELSSSAEQSPGYSKIEQKIIDFEDTAKYAEDFQGFDVGFCALGISSVGLSNEKYYHITHDYVVETAKLALAGGCKHFHFVSGASTSKTSMFFWARTKAEVEEKISEMGFERVSIYRPGGVIKDKTEVNTKMESAGICAAKVLDPLHLATVDTVLLGKVMVREKLLFKRTVVNN